MKLITILILIFTLLIICPTSVASWNVNTPIANGITFGHTFFTPDVFYKDDTWYLMSGSGGGTYYGWTWNGTTWVSNSSIVNGMPYIPGSPESNVFYKDGSWYSITNNNLGNKWNGSGWQSHPAIINGILYTGGNPTPDVWYDGTWKLLMGSTGGVTYGYHWSGTSWVSNSSLSIGDIGWQSKPSVFNDDGIWKVIIGRNNGLGYGHAISSYYGYYWGGSSWIYHSSIVDGLPIISSENVLYLSPTVFNDSGTLKLISGNRYGGIYAYQYTSVLSNISGTVSNSTDPIVGAEITVNTVPITSVITNATGYYSIPNIEEYTYTITATAAGYGTYFDSIVAVGDVVKDFEMDETTYDVSGTVTNLSGPVIGVNVTINGISDTTNVAGYYLISGLLPGIYTINATEFIHDYYSDSVTIIGDNIVKNFEMVETTYNVSGTVTNLSGPVIGVNVTINGNSNTTNAIGYYLITGSLPDTYTITATAVNHEDYSDSIIVSGDTVNDFKMAEYKYDSFILTADVLNAQNTALQSITTIFGTIRPGNTIDVTPSFNLTNSGNAPASVSATFTTFNESIYGFGSISGSIGGANFSLQKDSGTWNNLNNVNTGTPLTDTVLADNVPYNWNARLIIPAGQPGAVYTGTIELTFS